MSQMPDHFIAVWDPEAQRTAELLHKLPSSQYDFRPDAGGRSMGELAWHLAEIDGYISHSLESGGFDHNAKPPNIARPKTVAELASGYERIHGEAVARIRKLKPADMSRTMVFFDGKEMKVEDILWRALLHHLIHHRAQLVLMCRLAGGTPPGLYGPTREETAAMKAKG